MTLKRAHYGFIALLIGLFLAFQISASAHASSFGDTPHDHDGTICVVTTLAENDLGILPVEPEILAEPMQITFDWQQTYVSTPLTTNQTRAPPPRAPPAHIQ